MLVKHFVDIVNFDFSPSLRINPKKNLGETRISVPAIGVFCVTGERISFTKPSLGQASSLDELVDVSLNVCFPVSFFK